MCVLCVQLAKLCALWVVRTCSIMFLFIPSKIVKFKGLHSQVLESLFESLLDLVGQSFPVIYLESLRHGAVFVVSVFCGPRDSKTARECMPRYTSQNSAPFVKTTCFKKLTIIRTRKNTHLQECLI
uniref:Putative secreted protein n=1 Tax=Ixodes scapularis TaxID=6945 RepID=A0A4D5S1H8_IXOSC